MAEKMRAQLDSVPSVMETESTFQLYCQQFSALLKKNFLLSLRSKRATALQLASSLFFIFLIFGVDQSIQASRKGTTAFRNLFDPLPRHVTGIPPCESGFYIKIPCYDFVWSGNTSSNVAAIVKNIMNNNPGRPIPSTKVLEFATRSDVNNWLLANPMRCTGALHFEERRQSVIAYGVQTNSTLKMKRGKHEDPMSKFQFPLQLAAEREITRFVSEDASLQWSVAFKEFAHPSHKVFSTVGTIGPIFLLAAAMFGCAIQMSVIVAERELKLRQAMSIMGLIDSAFWLSWLLWEVFIVLISSLLIVLFGMMFQFYFFLNNSFGILFLMFFLFQLNMTGFSFLLSTFISKSSSARTVGFSVFIIGFLTQVITEFGFPYGNLFAKYLQVIWSFFPPNLLAIGLQYLGDATATQQGSGISWVGRKRCSFEDTYCALTMDQIYKWLTATFFLWLVLAIYFDNVLPDANGVRKSWLYFLRQSYWNGSDSSEAEGASLCSCTGFNPRPPENTNNEEVVAVEEKMAKQHEARESFQDSDIAVQVRGLVKTFPGGIQSKGCCKCQERTPYHAVKELWVNLERDEVFCLLGPNGAGKTTLISCLTGIVPVTSGNALVYGDSLTSTKGMSRIRRYMGVCPQFDILWDALTGLEHLHLFASIKGLPQFLIKSYVEELLSRVNLTEAAHVRAESYSGGMRRCLTVAIALIGDPKLVYLDEPTTGMDPVTRRYVWDIIEGAKKGRAIVLTTHSMEEADILGDRIAIMAKGKLWCIGTSISLKSRFGAGYIVNVTMSKDISVSSLQQEAEIKTKRYFVTQIFKVHLDVDPEEEGKDFITFLIPRAKENQLRNFFTELQEREADLGITDIQISLSTLEEVFMNIAKQADLETAATEVDL